MLNTKSLFKIGEISEDMALVCNELQKQSGVYLLYFTPELFYIGSTKNFKRRLVRHCTNLKKGIGVIDLSTWNKLQKAEMYLLELVSDKKKIQTRLCAENKYIVLLQPTLNKFIPLGKTKYFTQDNEQYKNIKINAFELQKAQLKSEHINNIKQMEYLKKVHCKNLNALRKIKRKTANN
jgi:hypothetical protein